MLSKRFFVISVSIVILSAFGAMGCRGKPAQANTTDPCAANYTGPAPTTAQCTACGHQSSCTRCCGYGAPAGCGAACVSPFETQYMLQLEDSKSAYNLIKAIPGPTYDLIKKNRLDGELIGLVNWLTPEERIADTEILLSYGPQEWASIDSHLDRAFKNYDKALRTWADAWGLDVNNPAHRYQIYSGWLLAWN